MATIEAPASTFKPHPEGTFLAVLRDNWLETRPNPWKGTTNNEGEVDERDTITELVLEFITDHDIEVKGQLRSDTVRFKKTASLFKNSALRKFLQGWFPALKEEDFKRFDADKLIGRGAYITVQHNVSKSGSVFANVVGAMQPPKNATVPTVPADFVRHDDRAPKAANPQAPVGQEITRGVDEDDLPF